jgi:hypothetical protein
MGRMLIIPMIPIIPGARYNLGIEC